MKNLIILTAFVLLTPVILKAQSADPELYYIKKAYSQDKKAIVEQYMGLDVQQSAKFWPVYGAYETRREKLAQERVKLIEKYVNSIDSLSPATADKLANAVLTNNVNLDRLNLEYYGKMKAAIGAVRAAKYIQLETYLQTAWRGFVQENIPLIGELDKTQQH